MFTKIVKNDGKGSNGGRHATKETITVNTENGLISIPVLEMKHINSMTKGPINALFASVEIDVDEKKIRIIPTASANEYAISRKNGSGKITIKNLIGKGLPAGQYLRVDACVYEFAG